VARVYVRTIEQLDSVLDRIADKAQTSTAIVKAQTIRRRPPPWIPGI
jgi:Lrp/AsnC family leucine-responsive transcriptional regulator